MFIVFAGHTYRRPPGQNVPRYQRVGAETHHIGIGKPEYQRRGIATTLLQHAVRTARDAGFRLLEIGTGDIGAGQIALYERCGFVRCGIDEDYFRKHYPAPIFENGVECRHMVRLRMELR